MSRWSAAVLVVAVWLGTVVRGPWWLAVVAPAVLGTAALVAERGGGSPAGATGGENPHRRPLLVVACVAAALCGAGLAGGRTAMRDAAWLREMTAARPQPLQVTVVSPAYEGPFDSWMIVRVEQVGSTRVRARGLLRSREPPAIGTVLAFDGRIRALGAGGFEDHVRSLGAGVVVLAVDAPAVVAEPSAVLRGTDIVRNRLHAVATDVLGPARAGLLTGLVTGDDRGRTSEVDDALDAAGLRHLVVVSGRHTALFLGAVLALSRLSRLGYRACRVAALGALVWFVVLVRWEPSVLRAGAVAAAVLMADLAGRDRDAVHVLAMAVLVVLLIDPLLGARLGFVLSVSATAGVLLLAPVAQERVPGPEWLRLPLGVTVAAQIAVAPILVATGRDLAPAGVLANLLAAPAAAVAQALGGLAALVSLVSPDAAGAVVRLAGWPVDAILWSARLAVAAVPGTPPAAGRLAVAVALAAAAVVLAAGGVRRSRARLIVLAAVAVALAPPGHAGDVDVLTITALDVGQGDALLVASPGPEGASRMLVDAGPEPAAVARMLVGRGVHRIDVVAVTHAHEDHSGGLLAVLRRTDVGALLMSPQPTGARRPTDVQTAAEFARDDGVAVVEVHAGDSFMLGHTRVQVLWPPPRLAPLSVNDASLVLRLDAPTGSALLTGDVEAAGQQALLRRPGMIDVDVLKVPHHGAATNASGFIEGASPAVALVSVGDDNDYGHPAASTLDDLRRAHVLRTDVDGEATVRIGSSGVEVVGRRRPSS